MAKELSEILINLSSHSGSRILNCTTLEPTCFVFDTKTGWNDAKIDLFYLAAITGMDVREGQPAGATTEDLLGEEQIENQEEENGANSDAQENKLMISSSLEENYGLPQIEIVDSATKADESHANLTMLDETTLIPSSPLLLP